MTKKITLERESSRHYRLEMDDRPLDFSIEPGILGLTQGNRTDVRVLNDTWYKLKQMHERTEKQRKK